jgi:hypothetical protein
VTTAPTNALIKRAMIASSDEQCRFRATYNRQQFQ